MLMKLKKNFSSLVVRIKDNKTEDLVKLINNNERDPKESEGNLSNPEEQEKCLC